MKIGGWWISPGRRTFEARTVTVPWLWVERDPYRFRVVLWGGRDGDVQVGSVVDAVRQQVLAVRARRERERQAFLRASVKMTMTFRDQVTPAMQRLTRQLAAAAESMKPPEMRL